MLKQTLLNFVLVFPISIYAYEQDINTQDSLITIFSIPDDTLKVDKLLAYGRFLIYSQPEKALKFSDEALSISKKIKYYYGIGESYRLQGAYYSDIKGDMAQSVIYYGKADSLFRSHKGIKYTNGIGNLFHNYGVIEQRKGNYVKSLNYYIQAAEVLASIKNETTLPKTYNNMSTMYSFLKLFDKAEFYARECIKLAGKSGDEHLISVGAITLAAALLSQEKFEGVEQLIQQSLKIASKRNDKYILYLCYYNLSTYYNITDPPKALDYAKLAFQEVQAFKNPWENSRAKLNLADLHFRNNKLAEALKLSKEVIWLCDSIGSPEIAQAAFKTVSDIEYQSGNTKFAYLDLKKAYELRDTVFKKENKQQINFYEAIYQKEKKEIEIIKLTVENRIKELSIKKKNGYIFFLIVSSCLSLLVIYIGYKNYNHKRKLISKENEIQKQKILELEKDRQLLATQSVLKGEELERTRLARDLHDGLGGLLLSIKLSLSGSKGNMMVSEDGEAQYNKALGLLDTSMKELRRVAHNMMPEALVKYGLKDALADFCSSLNNNDSETEITFQFFGEEKRIDSKYEIGLYRIAQELINNALKYSKAPDLMVQLIQETDRAHLTIQDNGKGFDMQILKTSKGAGIANIKSRVESLNGYFDVYSEPDKGTEASVEFKNFT